MSTREFLGLRIWRDDHDDTRSRGIRLKLMRASDDSWRHSVGIEAYWRRPVYLLGAILDVDQDGEGPIKLAFYGWPFSLYLDFEVPIAQRIAERLTKPGFDGERGLQLVACYRDGEWGTFRWNLWTPTVSWSSRTPRYRNGSFNIRDFLLGPMDHSSRDIETADVLVPMPEKSYPATVRVFESTWHRRRFRFLKHTMRRTSIDVPDGIPHPGKGENAWDCGEDATFGLTSQAATPEEAVGRLVASVLQQRERYGGRGWVPEAAKGGAA